jgi:hypothetical protein
MPGTALLHREMLLYAYYSGNKKTRPSRVSFCPDSRPEALLDLGFLVRDVFANNRIKFLYFHLFRHGALVLGRGVVVTGTGAGDEFDFITHAVFS